ncbi:alcohol acetyltransferase [Mycena latifolia]|nr:alcohol acetyltransferase [Mycena latifolia]
MSSRAAGLLESFHINRHWLGLDSCVVLSARYTCADGSILTKGQLFPALRKVIEAHPALGVKLEGEGTKPSFVTLETIHLPHIVQFSDNDDLEAAIQGQLARPFETLAPLPLWRVEVLNDGTVLLAFHHGIGDGLSGVAFHQSLLAALQQDIIVGDDSLTVAVPQSLSLLPPIETATNIRPSLRKVLTEVFYLFTPASWTPGYSAWTANDVPQIPELKPHVKVLTFSAAEMAAFAAACRSHGATVTSAFFILTTSTLSRLIPPSPQYKTLSANVAVSMRGVAHAPADAMCDYAAGYNTYPPLCTVFDWAAAARYAAELQRAKFVAREHVGMLLLLFGNIAGWLRGLLGRKRSGTFEISNAGRISASASTGRWGIGRMAFAQSDLVVGSALKLNVIGDPTGEVSVVLTWGESSIEQALVESFATQFQDGLRTLLV